MIVATIGHVDHGKTSLVRALTGVDTDRLPEEKARGMSIELGFAYRPVGKGEDAPVLGFVDVPGHERFVHTMVAGVAGIHHVLLIVAADDGPMPQTREHVAIVDLLGIASATVVITKVDRAEPARVAEVADQVRALLAPTALRDAPLFEVSSATGQGVEGLAQHLEELARAWSPPAPRGHFRLAVDRSFTLGGVGVVVTGTSFAGTVMAEDTVGVCPGSLRARVRGLHAQNRQAKQAGGGERCALNLAGAGVEAGSFRRGDWIVAPALMAPTRRIDARLRLLAGSAPLRQGTRLHVHIGARQATGRVFPLEGPVLEPGAEGLAQLTLDEDVGALWGDRLIVRDWSAQHTLGGGMILDPFAPARGRALPARLEVLRALEEPDPAAALAKLLEIQTDGVDLNRYMLARNLTPEEARRVLAAVEPVSVGPEREALAFGPAQWGALRERIVQALDHWHRRNPNAAGLSAEQLRRVAGIKLPLPVFNAMVAALVQRADLVRKGNLLHRPGHRTVMSPQEHQLWQRLKRLMEAGGLRPPPVGELANALRLEPPAVLNFLKRAAQQQLVVQVAENRFYLRHALLELARRARELAEEHEKGLFPAASFRDRTGIGRNLSIEVLQYFDRVGYTRRIGDARRVIRHPDEVFGPRD